MKLQCPGCLKIFVYSDKYWDCFCPECGVFYEPELYIKEEGGFKKEEVQPSTTTATAVITAAYIKLEGGDIFLTIDLITSIDSSNCRIKQKFFTHYPTAGNAMQVFLKELFKIVEVDYLHDLVGKPVTLRYQKGSDTVLGSYDACKVLAMGHILGDKWMPRWVEVSEGCLQYTRFWGRQ